MDHPAEKRFLVSSAADHDALCEALEADGVTCERIAALSQAVSSAPLSIPQILLLDPPLLATGGSLLETLSTFLRDSGVLIALQPPGQEWVYEDIPAELIWAYEPQPYDLRHTRRTIASAYLYLNSRLETVRVISELDAYSRKLQELNRIGVALSTERDHDALLDLILRKCREVTQADAGSLYLVEDTPHKEKILRFKLSQNESFNLSYKEFTMPISRGSIAGYVALSGISLNLSDVYHLPPGAAYRFDRNWDQKTGYRTKSMLVVPMKNRNNETIGIVQLINRKKQWESILLDAQVVEDQVVPFDSWSEELVNSLASQAAVALENNILYKNIQNLFEGFVKASVTAIESRDPTTSGHSSRVAALTVGLAEVVDRIDNGRFKDVKFTREQIKEVRYASLLHDFGKVGVREEVLVKAKKLYPWHSDLVKSRFEYLRKALEAEHSAKQLDYILEHGREEFLAQHHLFKGDYEKQVEEIDRFIKVVLEANEPTVLEDGNFATLLEIAQRTFLDIAGTPRNLLTPEEVGYLSIRRGSLDAKERLEIESHVTHTYRFLSQIPWTTELQGVPAIAYAHHEKLNGSGYPNRLQAKEIPIQSKMMTIADIYDALTASDRPYKKAVPLDKALKILEFESKDGNIDSDLLQIFVDAKIYEFTMEGATGNSGPLKSILSSAG
ncbi:MAG: GAF domain-containing protein [Candidatus Sericytochromatia bacterium]|uniref:GAF domain-containing protein n=1 Tax=Candidatus Tanganyikabacteria bacterium TaxID=2961651 RepID=A0A937X0B7_9BACT|nr:GAF domain-containing protein [Candidatus Tanganyikabacteria bacterium]